MIWEYFKYFEFGYCKFGNAIFYDTFDLICGDQIKQKIVYQCGQLAALSTEKVSTPPS